MNSIVPASIFDKSRMSLMSCSSKVLVVLMMLTYSCFSSSSSVEANIPENPHNGIERRTDFMAHVGEECGFQFIRLFRTVLGGNQFRLHLFPFSDNQRRAHQGQRLIVLVVGSTAAWASTQSKCLCPSA